ncbi:MAG: single-stranded-DNA-specific exonuclease RecJ, partial [Pseudobdellovibrionaceae bacterium]
MDLIQTLTNQNTHPKTALDQLHSLSKAVLISRGILPNDLTEMLDFSLAKLQDPMSLLGMERAVNRLYQALLHKERILIYGDYDLDGSSGVCLLKMGLDQLGFPHVGFYQPDRHKEGYGVHPQLISGFADQGITLILTVDVGITAHQAAEECLRHGIDLVITDHHLPQESLPKAYVIVNPNQKDDASDLKFLCGAAVGFYLIRALKRKWSLEKLPHSNLDLKSLLPYVVLSTVTDMVPLIKDNRILVKHGLDAIPKTALPSWKELLKKFTYGKKRLQVSDVSISIAPKLNALTRMSGELTPVEYLLSSEQTLLKERLDYLVQKNKERETEQQLAQEIAQELARVRTQNEHFLFVANSN